MKKFASVMIFLIACLTFALPQGASAQADWETLWVLSSYPSPAYPWMSGTLAFTGLGYDRVRDKLYVVSPKTNQGMLDVNVFILDPATGDTLGKLFVDKNIINTGFSFGRFSLFKVQVSDEGNIYAGNLVTPLWGICYPGPPPNCQPELLNQGAYKIFGWFRDPGEPIDSLIVTKPKLVYQTGAGPSDTAFFGGTMTYTRWGDAFGIVGSGDSTQIFVSGGDPSGRAMNSEFNCFQALNDSATEFGLKRKMISSLNGLASHGLAPTGRSKVKPVWVDSNSRVASLQSQDQTPVSIDDIPVSMTHTSGPIRYFELPTYGRKFVVVADGKNDLNGDSTSARLIDVTLANDYFLVGSPTPPINNRALQNSSGFKNWVADVDYKIDNFRITLFVLMSGNGIGAYRSTFNIPVELANLRAQLSGDVVNLSWFISQETNNRGFDVQRSYDGETWESITFINGRGTTNEVKTYLYEDPIAGMSITSGEVLYRLKQHDFDGKFNYSPVVRVLLAETPTTVLLGQNYPNPFNPTTTISYQIAEPSFVSLRVYNAVGQEVRTVVRETMNAGAHQATVDGSDLAAGVYYYRLTALGRTVQKKMVVVK